ncbi:MAG: hypothetical protein U1E05_14600, partial [Patescibacteria group bacterium]|nr:hypothetical protein [Patescibacteria group bacterium]
LSLDGFDFIRTGIGHAPTHDRVVQAVFGTFFGALLVMLVFSSGIILFGALFQSEETAFLLTLPLRAQRVFLHKFQDAVLLSSWGFLLLGSPMLIAYGVVAEAPWYYYALLGPFMVGFIYIPAAFGSLLCLLVVYWIPAARLKVLLLSVVLLGVFACWAAWSVVAGPESDLLTPSWFQEMLARLSFTEGRLLPSWWLSSGLLEATRGDWSQSVLFLALIVANALMSQQLATLAAGRLYRRAYSALHGQGRRRRSRGPAMSWLDAVTLKLLAPFPPPMRLLALKDLRVFRRDPVQWSQFLIFFGLLLLYFLNIRRLSYDMYYIGWVNMVSFLNLAVVGLLMSTFTTRFIYPMLSLEGRRFWVLGLMPISRDTVLWSKFFFAVGGATLPCCALVLLSDIMLRVTPLAVVSHQLTCVVLCVGLAGIAVGLGARLPNLREQSPSRIAAGFGGTMNLVISALYIVAVVMLTAVPMHFYVAAQGNHAVRVLSGMVTIETWLLWWLGLGTLASIGLGVAATAVPLAIGIRAFRKLEF